MGDYRNDCCEPADCCEPCREPHCQCSHDCCHSQNSCGSDAFGGLGIIILLAVLYLLFCSGDNNGRGGLLGGLF